MTERRLIARFPFDSVDSTTWISGSAYDELPTDAGRARGFSFLSDVSKARIWLDFFDRAPKAHLYDRNLMAKGTAPTAGPLKNRRGAACCARS